MIKIKEKNVNMIKNKGNEMFNTPILFLIFNRPDVTEKVFEAIRQAQPKQLFVAADGARNEKENFSCEQTRKIIEKVDWDCEVKTLFREENLGCQKAVSAAIDWFFEHVEEGIILEDDCLPSQSFFPYCEELLEYYRDDTRIMMISGGNRVEKTFGDASYYFSNLPDIWGWATWKRAWKLYDIEMKNYTEFKKQGIIKNIFENKDIQKYWLGIFDKIETLNSWGYVWAYTMYSNSGLCICSNKNLISNIGCDSRGSHTTDKNDPRANRKTFEIQNITHPQFIVYEKEVTDIILKNRYNKNEKLLRIFKHLKRKIKL